MGDAHGNARFCSTKCSKKSKDAAYYLRHREVIREGQAIHRQQKRPTGRTCCRIGCIASLDHLDLRARYCTSDCHRVATAMRRAADEQYQANQRRTNAAWKQKHPEKARRNASNYEQTRRARQLAAFIEQVDRQVVWTRDGGVCHICKLPVDPARWHLEHIIPLSRGGEHSYANTAVSHPACNLAKGARLP